MRLPTAGELRERIDILDVAPPYNAATGAGEVEKVFAAGVWAKIEPLGGDISAETMHSRVCRQQYRVWIRYRYGVTPFHEIQWKDRRLIIDGPPEHLAQWLLLHAFTVIT